MSRSNPSRMPPGTSLRLTRSAPVVVVRAPRVPGVFSYSDDQWAMVVSANSWHPDTDLHQLLFAREAAGQRYRISRRNLRSQSPRALRQMLELDVLRAWTTATGDTALRLSHTHGAPTGPLIRYLDAALDPILGGGMVGHETLVRDIRSVRSLRESG